MKMAIEYKWQFPSLEVTYDVDGLENVVTVVHWRLNAADGIHNASSYGACGVGSPTPEAFVSYEDITEEEVVEWVTTALGGEDKVETMKDGLAAQIATLKAPKSGSMTPPWMLVASATV
jgi:hypothetical protein